MSEPYERIVAQLILRRPSRPVTAANIKAERSSPEALAAARQSLEELGFSIEAEGPLSLSFSGSTTLIHEVFGLTPGDPDSSAGKLPSTLQGVASEVVLPIAPEFFR